MTQLKPKRIMPVVYVGTLVEHFSKVLTGTGQFTVEKYTSIKSLPRNKYMALVYVNNITNREITVANDLVDISIGIEIYLMSDSQQASAQQWPEFLERVQLALETITAKSEFPVGLSKVVVNTSFDQQEINNRPTLWAAFECICSVFAHDRR